MTSIFSEIETGVENFFTGAEADVSKVMGGVGKLTSVVPGVLGLAGIAADGIALAAPAIGVPAAAAVSALQASYGALTAAVGEGGTEAKSLAAQVAQVGSDALNALDQVLPFFHATANDVAVAVAQAKTVAAAVAVSVPAAAPAAPAAA